MADAERYLGAMRVVEDPAVVARAGDWLVAGTHGRSRVHSLVPDLFERYARIFHPAMREATERDLPCRAPGESRTGAPVHLGDHGIPWVEVSWREIAEGNGRVAHPAMQWPSITGSYEFGWSSKQPDLWEQGPAYDTLPLRLTRVLCEILAAFTGTPERCWCAVWEGYGDLSGLSFDPTLPRLEMEQRPLILVCGSLAAVPEASFSDPFVDDPRKRAVRHYRSPSLWWPDDRAWCVATDVDVQTTYLGASEACIERVVHDGRLEATRVTVDQDISIDGDTVNPKPSGGRAEA